jgi:hypothetical protein
MGSSSRSWAITVAKLPLNSACAGLCPTILREDQKALGADLTQFNGEDSWTLPMPARYVIAQDGTIAYAEVSADYTRRPEPSAIFPVLEQLGRQHVA